MPGKDKYLLRMNDCNGETWAYQNHQERIGADIDINLRPTFCTAHAIAKIFAWRSTRKKIQTIQTIRIFGCCERRLRRWIVSRSARVDRSNLLSIYSEKTGLRVQCAAEFRPAREPAFRAFPH